MKCDHMRKKRMYKPIINIKKFNQALMKANTAILCRPRA